MSTEVEKKVVKSVEEMEKEFVEPKIEPVKGMKGLLQVAEVKMLLYVIPVALVLLVVALLLNGNK
jgi:hypothetical protein